MTSTSVDGPAEPQADQAAEAAERVTIVVPVYNRAGPLLADALDSLLSQDYPNLEALAIDDGSTDDTPGVLEGYAQRHPGRFRWAQQANQGQAATLNRGFAMAEGTLLGYLSSDDVLLPGAISRLARELAADTDAVLAYPAYRVIGESGEELDTMTPPEYSRVESVRLQDTIVGPGALFRAGALKRAGPLRTDLRYLWDSELWLRLSREGRFVRVEEPLACWRRHGGSLTLAEAGREMADERLRILDAAVRRGGRPGASGGPRPGLPERLRAGGDGGRARLQRSRRALLRRRSPRPRGLRERRVRQLGGQVGEGARPARRAAAPDRRARAGGSGPARAAPAHPVRLRARSATAARARPPAPGS